MTTQYEARVSEAVRKQTNDLMERWREDGRDDEEIENIVPSLVLMAYVHGRADALLDAVNAVQEVREARG